MGAVAATVGIFLPSFVFVALSARLMSQAKQSVMVRAFMDGVNVASLALMAVVALQLGETALVDAFILREIGDRLPLRAGEAEALRALFKTFAQEARGLV